MTHIAGKLFGTIRQGGQPTGYTAPRAPQCAMDSQMYCQSTVDRKLKCRAAA